MRPRAEWAIASEALMGGGGGGGGRNNCLSKIQPVGEKYRDKTTLAS